MSQRLAVVIVLYQMKIADTPNYLLLKEVVNHPKLHLFIYDNSPLPQEDALFLQQNVTYRHNPDNPGLATAYNEAIAFSQANQCELLLLLDQDTEVPASYFDTLIIMPLDPTVAVYVPIVEANGQQISPVYSDQYVGLKGAKPTAGIANQPLMAINSGTVITAETLRWLEGFSEEFPLDYLDHWFFYQLNQANKKIEVLPVHLKQELSVLDYRTMSSQRYRSIIEAETLFYRRYDQEKFSHHRRHLFLRSSKQFLTVKNRQIWRQTLAEFLKLMKG